MTKRKCDDAKNASPKLRAGFSGLSLLHMRMGSVWSRKNGIMEWQGLVLNLFFSSSNPCSNKDLLWMELQSGSLEVSWGAGRRKYKNCKQDAQAP